MISTDDIHHGKILIVDDQEANVQLLTRMLLSAGFTSITSTTNPFEVCTLHRNNHYDLILLDLQMPGFDGFQVMEGLKEIETDNYLPVLVITAQPEQKLRALTAGAKDFIGKPFELSEVMLRVHNMLEVRLLHGETKDYSKALEKKVREVEESHEQTRKQSDKIKILYEQIVAEQKRSNELSLLPSAMVGVEQGERLATPWFTSLKLRHHWLQINLFTAFIAAAVVGLFQTTIDHLLILTMFLPVLAGQSGNTGSQALAITLRGITLGDLKTGREIELIKKESLLGLLNGALVGLVAALGMYIVASLKQLPSAAILSAVVVFAMIGSCIISGMSGAIVPLVLKRFGADPVTASTIFLTTATDVASMGMLLGLAAFMVP